MLMFPKPVKKPKARKPLTRKTRLKPGKVKFVDYDSPKRSRRLTDAEVNSLAIKARMVRLSNPTEAEIAVEAILRRLGIAYEREVIINNGDRFLLADFLLPKWNLILEIDGSQHRQNREYDQKRSAFLARRGYKVMRFWNAECLNGKADERLVQTLGLDKKIP